MDISLLLAPQDEMEELSRKGAARVTTASVAPATTATTANITKSTISAFSPPVAPSSSQPGEQLSSGRHYQRYTKPTTGRDFPSSISPPSNLKEHGGYYQKTWTENENARVYNLRKNGMKWKDIGNELGRGAGSCRAHYSRRFGCNSLNKKWTDAQRKQIYNLRHSGKGWKDIGNEIGRSAGSCRMQYSKRFGCNSLNKKWTVYRAVRQWEGVEGYWQRDRQKRSQLP